MTRRRARIIGLVEDRQHSAFIRRLLRQLYDPRELRITPPPADQTGGLVYVRERYADEVTEFRRKASHQQSLRLVVMVDADNNHPDERLQELDDLLLADDQERRGPQEHIAILTPKRNIETWIRWLEGNPVNESTRYPKLDYERRCKTAVDRLVALMQGRAELPGDCPSSLRKAIGELDRLK